MKKRDRFDAKLDKSLAVKKADAAGEICDSMAVRTRLVERMQAGEMTYAEVQAELKRIRRAGRKSGVPTRQQVWSRS